MSGRFLFLLGAVYIHRVRPFRTVRDFKCHRVAFLKFIKGNSLQFVRVEKEVFFLARALDEAEASIGLTGNGSFWHKYKRKFCE